MRGDPAEWESMGPTAVSIGVFDGVHVGHRRVLAGLVAEANEIGVVPAVLTFDPHPLEVLNPERAPGMLTTIDQRIEQFEQIGIGLVGVIAISDVRHLLPDEFARSVLHEKLNARQVTVGADFRFGKGREGDAEFLRGIGSELGWTVDVVDMFGLHHG
ncbi:MAG TPA: bifunctional riboflavin kinase/FAD synthetase, partial [Acidimicrobiia bacterium]